MVSWRELTSWASAPSTSEHSSSLCFILGSPLLGCLWLRHSRRNVMKIMTWHDRRTTSFSECLYMSWLRELHMASSAASCRCATCVQALTPVQVLPNYVAGSEASSYCASFVFQSCALDSMFLRAAVASDFSSCGCLVWQYSVGRVSIRLGLWRVDARRMLRDTTWESWKSSIVASVKGRSLRHTVKST